MEPSYQRQALPVWFQKINRACLGADGSQGGLNGKPEPLLQVEATLCRDADGIVDRQFAVPTHDLCHHCGALDELALRRIVQLRLVYETAHLSANCTQQRDLVGRDFASVSIDQTQQANQRALGNEWNAPRGLIAMANKHVSHPRDRMRGDIAKSQLLIGCGSVGNGFRQLHSAGYLGKLRRQAVFGSQRKRLAGRVEEPDDRPVKSESILGGTHQGLQPFLQAERLLRCVTDSSKD